MPPAHAAVLFFAGLIAGAINSVAGGGGFIAFPALLFIGIPPISANATNTVALWPGTVASTGAYRRELARLGLRPVLPLMLMSALGSIVGALLLLRTPQPVFLRMVPWLLLAATLLFTFAGRLTSWIARRHPDRGPSRALITGIAALQLLIAVYVGYFGAGAGILILALLALMGMDNIHTMNGYKTLLASCANGIAVITFSIAGVVAWMPALVMTLGATLGGYAGAYYAQKMPPQRVRHIVIATGFTMTAIFFWRQ